MPKALAFSTDTQAAEGAKQTNNRPFKKSNRSLIGGKIPGLFFGTDIYMFSPSPALDLRVSGKIAFCHLTKKKKKKSL